MVVLVPDRVIGQNGHPMDYQPDFVIKLRLLVLQAILGVPLGFAEWLFPPRWLCPVLHLRLEALEQVADAVGAVVVPCP